MSEMKRVVVYEAEVIDSCLREMDNVLWQVRGMATMNTIVNVFNTLKTSGSVQEAELAPIPESGFMTAVSNDENEEVDEYDIPGEKNQDISNEDDDKTNA